MGKKGMDVLLVRKSGPVQAVTFRTWWIYFLFLVLILMLLGMGAGSFLLYGQQEALKKLADDTRLIMLRTERLEALVQEQETREVLAMQADMEKQAAENAKNDAAQSGDDTPPEAGKSQPEPEKKALDPVEPKSADTEQIKDQAQTTPEPKAEAEEKQEKADEITEPAESDQVGIRNVQPSVEANDLFVLFDVVNKTESPSSEPLMGYVSVIMRGQKRGNPWVESWPPMRLTPQGRPMNYRRGAPFSIHRFRRMKAKYDALEKKPEKLEFVIYSREGQLLLVSSAAIDMETSTPKETEKEPTEKTTEGAGN
ncbi:hypothetical protein [Dethiosulfatarculus sandiegensis]|uniref:Uncharacterized protein n=1 Tax=Dethiosulfatarculus sandiegensis TaxID=1429043 RepID=A0A0D2HUG6_9BACT|nr:hypothetical protein [Dethiosulfatarculus sandiegensis]KIX14083.1 hypothetical protein X474_10640 [Dethiosulfatarculus sandiegensis]